MCGIVGVVAYSPVNQTLYDALLLLQHRGQDSAGIVTEEASYLYTHKAPGLVQNVFHTRHMRELRGNMGIGHCRYPTAGSSFSEQEAQPFYVNAPFGIALGHNGNLTNGEELRQTLFKTGMRHINTNSDSEILLNVLALELERAVRDSETFNAQAIFTAMDAVHRRCRGAYAAVALIAGQGLVAFRDPYGIRPLVVGQQKTPEGMAWMVASESVALEALGFDVVRDVAPGETLFIARDGQFFSQTFDGPTQLMPCIFEYVYLARPDSTLDGALVYDTHVRMGAKLAEKIRSIPELNDIDVVIPIPDSSRPSAMELARVLKLPYREGYVKNRYVGRTFIMPGQALREKSVRRKLNPVGVEFKNKAVLLVDDSIVRGTTSKEIVQMARDAGARKVYFASASPPVRYPNVYGIDMPSQKELVAHQRSEDEIARVIGADVLIYQDMQALEDAVRESAPTLTEFETSCFTGHYVTGDIDAAYLKKLAQGRADAVKQKSLIEET
ncbi:MAG: amidophosphoribosyltransferase [Proteobacteria bacterium]|nr:amidophosphoribosyltransferase [Pseudomonadota bacterium]MCL2307583.1 amidophosphoribosyltransferase [Pseudomonadota bacterium]